MNANSNPSEHMVRRPNKYVELILHIKGISTVRHDRDTFSFTLNYFHFSNDYQCQHAGMVSGVSAIKWLLKLNNDTETHARITKYRESKNTVRKIQTFGKWVKKNQEVLQKPLKQWPNEAAKDHIWGPLAVHTVSFFKCSILKCDFVLEIGFVFIFLAINRIELDLILCILSFGLLRFSNLVNTEK
jgi:hypothetical protein